MSSLSKKQVTALKFAINTMDRNFKRYCMSTMYCGEERVSFGEAINILADMVKENQEVENG